MGKLDDKKLSDLTVNDVSKIMVLVFLGVISGFGILFLIAWLL